MIHIPQGLTRISLGEVTVLVVCAHPDDEVLGAGAVIADLALGRAKVIVVCLTRGERGGDPVVRSGELTQGCRVLGVSPDRVYQGDLGDLSLSGSEKERRFLSQFTDDAPEMVLTHANCGHPDHRAVHALCLEVFGDKSCIYTFASPFPSPEDAFLPCVAMPVTEAGIRRQEHALLCHRSQQHKAWFPDALRGFSKRASCYGMSVGEQYAVAFDSVDDPGRGLN